MEIIMLVASIIVLGVVGKIAWFFIGFLFQPTPNYSQKNQPPAASLCGPYCRDWNFTGWSPEQIREYAFTNPIPAQRVDDIEHLIGEVITPQKQTRPAPQRSTPAALPSGQAQRSLPAGRKAASRDLPGNNSQRALPAQASGAPIPIRRGAPREAYTVKSRERKW